MVVITAIYVVATILICYFNGKSASAAQKQIIEANRQQQQNANIQLYTLRRQVLNIFINEKYDEIFWDVSFLFNEEIFEKFKYLCEIKREWTQVSNKINSYKKILAEKSESSYIELENLILNTKNPCTIESDWEELYKFCDNYIFEQQVGNKIEIYNYRELDMELRKLVKEGPNLHIELALEMQDFIKKSIEMP